MRQRRHKPALSECAAMASPDRVPSDARTPPLLFQTVGSRDRSGPEDNGNPDSAHLRPEPSQEQGWPSHIGLDQSAPHPATPAPEDSKDPPRTPSPAEMLRPCNPGSLFTRCLGC